jgi:hypothetical protein
MLEALCSPTTLSGGLLGSSFPFRLLWDASSVMPMVSPCSAVSVFHAPTPRRSQRGSFEDLLCLFMRSPGTGIYVYLGANATPSLTLSTVWSANVAHSLGTSAEFGYLSLPW